MYLSSSEPAGTAAASTHSYVTGNQPRWQRYAVNPLWLACNVTNTGRCMHIVGEYGNDLCTPFSRGSNVPVRSNDEASASPVEATIDASTRRTPHTGPTPTALDNFHADVAQSTAGEDAEAREFRFFRGVKTPRFVNDSEQQCAEILDFYGIPWEYEPITFVLETNEAGHVTEAFSPDFYLPEQNLFLEVTTMKQELVTRKNRKVRKLRQRYPDVNVKLFYRRDIEALGQKLQSRRGSFATLAESASA